MCLISNSLIQKKGPCKCANACLKNNFKGKGLVQFQSDKIKLVVQSERFRPVFKAILLNETHSENNQVAFTN